MATDKAADRFSKRRAALSRRRWSRIAYVSLAAAAVIVLSWLVWFSPALTARSVEVSIDQAKAANALTPEQVRRAAQVPLGTPLARQDLQAIGSRVETVPVVKSAEVSRSWPRTISIAVIERTAVVWVSEQGRPRGIDRSGVNFRSFDRVPRGLIEARASATKGKRRAESLVAIGAVAHAIEQKNPSWAKQIRLITADTQDSVTLILAGNRRIIWGGAALTDRKLQVLTSLLTIKATRYDVSAPDQPTTGR